MTLSNVDYQTVTLKYECGSLSLEFLRLSENPVAPTTIIAVNCFPCLYCNFNTCNFIKYSVFFCICNELLEKIYRFFDILLLLFEEKIYDDLHKY